MGQSWFQFKQFTVNQEHCAQKVGTLSCILGALADHPAPNNILDIGTGTGLLSLMMAQRFPSVKIDAVEIDSVTAMQARENFLKSPWKTNLRITQNDILSYQPKIKYDIIVSNPPFYKDHQTSHHNHINLARHSMALHFLQLAPWISRHLAEDGKSWILLPPREMEQMVSAFKNNNLELEALYHIYIRPQGPEKARIACFSPVVSVARNENFYIHEPSGAYSAAFINLLQHFYLHL